MGVGMSEEKDAVSNLPRSWSETFQSIAEGGIPQIIAGPAGKAISRLIGAGAEIPAAWLEQRAQGIRDETEARSKMMQALTEKSIELGLADPKLLYRGLNSLLGRAYREQQNREVVAVKVIEQLADHPPPPNTLGPSDDWMNIFEGYAAQASSEWVRENWARVLAGEIRAPSSFSLQTLAFLSQLDKEAALAVEETLSRTVAGEFVMIGKVYGEEFEAINAARSMGVINDINHDVTYTVQLGANGAYAFDQNGVSIVALGQPGDAFDISCNTVTRVGRELHKVLRPPHSENAISVLINSLMRQGKVNRIARGVCDAVEGALISKDLAILWARRENGEWEASETSATG